jgi:hypothetical protein
MVTSPNSGMRFWGKESRRAAGASNKSLYTVRDAKVSGLDGNLFQSDKPQYFVLPVSLCNVRSCNVRARLCGFTSAISSKLEALNFALAGAMILMCELHNHRLMEHGREAVHFDH